MSKLPPVRTQSTVNTLKGPKNCSNLNGSSFVIFFDQCERTSKNSVLIVSEILWLFVNVLTTDDNYSLSVKALREKPYFPGPGIS